MTSIINKVVLQQADPVTFRRTKPFPWWSPHGFLTEETFEGLVRTVPSPELFRASFDRQRGYGQESHNRYKLRYREGLPVSPEWQAFIQALKGMEYRSFIARMFGTKEFGLSFQWLYTPRGCSVSAHCDARRKLGVHLFYLATPHNWKKEWGGETLLLDDRGRLSCNSAPRLSDFAEVIAPEIIGNRSLLFMRTDHAWHAVRELTQPEGVFRMLFTVGVGRKPSILTRLRSRLSRFVPSGWGRG